MHFFLNPRRTLAKTFLCGLAVLLAPSLPAHAGDNWPRFRGPNGLGVSADAVPVKWTEKDYAWKTELPGEGHSSPIVWGDDVFVTAADEDEGRRSLVCISAIDGKIRWRHDVEFKAYHKHGENSYAASTPAVDDKFVYVQWTTQDEFNVYAIHRDSGKQAWRAELGSYNTQHGGGGSPIAHGGLVVVNVDQDKPGSFVAALDRDTGDVRWQTPRDSKHFSTSTPCVFTPPGAGAKDQLIFTTQANGFTSLDAATGHILWEMPGAFEARVVSSPFVVGKTGMLLGACGEGGRGLGVVVVKAPATDGDKPEVAYKLTQETPYVPTPIVYLDRLFTWSDSGTVTCLDAVTGKEIWSDRVKAGFFGSPICADGKLYCVSKRGEVFVVDATADKFKQLAKNPLGEASDATPAVANGKIFLRTLTHLICVGPREEQKKD